MEPQKALKSKITKLGNKTYFFDVKESSNEKKYLKITEARIVSDDMPAKRSLIILFPDEIEGFISALAESDTWIKENTF